MQRAMQTIYFLVDSPLLKSFSLDAPLITYHHIGIHNYHVEPCSVEVEFANDSKFSLLAEFLRVYSPAADGKIRSTGDERVISGCRNVGIMSAEPDYFYNLGSNKFTLMRNYIKTLKKHERSRDPPKRK